MNLAEVVRTADHDRAQPQRRRRQQPGIERAADTDRRTEDFRGLRLELRPELVPVNEVRPDQRGNQRNDEGNRQSEQRRLHGVSSWACSGAPPLTTAHAETGAGTALYIRLTM